MTSTQVHRLDVPAGSFAGPQVAALLLLGATIIDVFRGRRDASPVHAGNFYANHRTGLHIATCKLGCGTTTRTDGAHSYQGGSVIICRNPDCQRILTAKAIQGTYNADKPCNARCMNATGPACDCHCSGANHGGRHAA